MDGKPAFDDWKERLIRFDCGQMTWIFKGGMVAGQPIPDQKFTYEIGVDPAAKPKTIDFLMNNKPFNAGIYELKENRLTVCFCYDADQRPKKLSTKDKEFVNLIVMDRVKDEPAANQPSDADQARKKLVEELKGQWSAVEYYYDGEKVDEQNAKKTRAAFDGERLTITGWVGVSKGQRFYLEDFSIEYKLSVTAEKKPHVLELVIDSEDDPNQGDKISAILELDGDSLKLCIGDKKTPGAFPKEAKESKEQSYWVFKRK